MYLALYFSAVCVILCFFLFPCVQDFHGLLRYLNQFPPSEFLPAMSNFHLLVFLATSNILPLKVMFMCWLQACDEITANELQRDALWPKSVSVCIFFILFCKHFLRTDMENLSNNQQLLKSVISQAGFNYFFVY